MKKSIIIILTLSLLINLSACSIGKGTKTEKLSDNLNIKAKTQEEIKVELDKTELTEKEGLALTDFSISVLKHAVKQNGDKNQNTLVSGMSILPCLGMVQNGAVENTLKQMEDALGFNKNILNKYLYEYRIELEGEEEQKLLMANSIWLKQDENLKVEKDFLQENTDFYNAEIYEAPFDETTLSDINAWVDKHTNGMIKKIINKIPEQAIMYLINAIYFTDTWEDKYDEDDIEKTVFFTEDNKVQDVELMFSIEDIYLEDENTIGVMKAYKDYNYSFIALLPNINVSMDDYIKSLNAKEFHQMVNLARQSSQDFVVETYIPKFKTEYDILLNKTLEDMGMTDAFNIDKSDFSKLGTYLDQNIFISKVIHKTYIEVDEKGTKAAAVTATEFEAGCAIVEEEPIMKTVRLDRPFVYMIYDNKNDIPIFMGTLMNVEE